MALPKPGSSVSSVSKSDNGHAPTAAQASAERREIKVKAPAFIRAASVIKPRLIANIQGVEGSGKDHMAFGYDRGPIYVHSFDQGLEGVVQKFQDKREIYVAEYELRMQPDEGTAKEVGEAANVVWTQFKSNMMDSYASTRKEGLVVVDTGSECWELLRLAYFGKLTQIMPHMYAKPNAEFRELVREGFDASNVAWLHKMVDEWENYTDSQGKEKGRKTGEKVFRGMNDIPFLVQCSAQTWQENRAGGGQDFYATILGPKCRLNPDLIGMTIGNDFNELLTLMMASIGVEV
jgi:hypothetical protein